MPTGIYKHKPCSKETKKKIGESNKISVKRYYENNISPLKGRKGNQEQIKRLAELNRGKKLSLETRLKMSKSRMGKNSPNWKGGITPENEKIRKSFEYKLWRKSCFERDNFTCQVSGQSGGRLVVHHINSFDEFPELRTSIENGITMTKELHIEFHKEYGYGNNTREQLEEFILIKRFKN